jgi:BirA family biotin operon repressor/biotin-[acetyl-CoA-carboxylase] ligase
MSKGIDLDKLQIGLHTKRFGKRLFFLHEAGSTNDVAKELANYGAEEGTVVIAETQTAGRGRLKRKWFSPKGGLYFSIVLRPELSAEEAVKLVFVAGLAVANVLDEAYGLKVETKWPNDVLVNGKKICGVLCEMGTIGEKVNYAIIGTGINANVETEKELPKSLRALATSLESELGKKVKLEELFRVLLERLECVYEQFLKEGFNPILERWKSYAGFLGKQVAVAGDTESFCGLALDVDSEGALVLRLDDGIVKRVFVGDLSMRVDGESLRFVVGCDLEEVRRYLKKARRYQQEGERERLESFLRRGLLNLIVWRLNGEVVGDAIWHESSTDEHRMGDPRYEEDKEALRKLLGRKNDFVELHEVWLLEEHRGKGYGERFFEFFEDYMRSKGYERIVFYANHPAALAICRKRGYKEGDSVNIDGVAEYIFYLQLRK